MQCQAIRSAEHTVHHIHWDRWLSFITKSCFTFFFFVCLVQFDFSKYDRILTECHWRHGKIQLFDCINWFFIRKNKEKKKHNDDMVEVNTHTKKRVQFEMSLFFFILFLFQPSGYDDVKKNHGLVFYWNLIAFDHKHIE